MLIAHEDAKLILGQITGNLGHPFHTALIEQIEKKKQYFNRLNEIVNSGKAGSLDGDLESLHEHLKSV